MRKVKLILKPILLLLLILNVSNSIAQQSVDQTANTNENNPEEPCAIDNLHEQMLNNDPEYALRYADIERGVQSYIASHSGEERLPILTVPLVVHIMHTGQPIGTDVNITDEQILSAVAGLNEDFRKMPGTNGDGIGVDCEIEFCLAVRDPDGNPTNGINRVDASGLGNYATNGVYAQSSGVSDASLKALSKWPNTDYYNIWVVTEIDNNGAGGGIQGYAYYPGASSAVDGTVILYNAFGTVGNLKSYTNMNRTTTHELGHGLNLIHTFQGQSCSETNCSTQGDKVCDTPPTPQAGSCSSPSCGGTQMVENYMDYTSQTCKNSYTQGQKDRMRATLQGYRASLLTSDACTPVFGYDAGIYEIVSPELYECSTSISPIVKVVNYGGTTINSLDIEYTIDSGPSNTYSFTGTIDPQEVVEIVLPTVSTSAGSHVFTATTSNPNGETDGFPSNDNMTSNFEIISGEEITMVFKQDMHGHHNTWEILDDNDEIVAQGGPYDGENGEEHLLEICMPIGCYDLVVQDSYGNGLIAIGDYWITDENGNELVNYDGEDFSENTHNFCLGGVAPTADFEADSPTACVGSGVSFTDLSLDAPTSWAWVFEGADNMNSSVQNPTGITYSVPGIYDVTLTVTNSYGTSTEVKSDFITVTDGPGITGTQTDPTCANAMDGSITALVGGQSPFEYVWSTGDTTETISGLAAGTYTVTVTDANGCSSTHSFELIAPDSINIVEILNISDFDNTGIGELEVSVSGGNPIYNLSWIGPGGPITGEYNLNNLVSGNYTLTVNDANGCTETMEFFIANDEPLVVDFESNLQNICVGESVDFTDLSIGMGVSWSWDFGNGFTSNDQNPNGITFTGPGTYIITLTVTSSYNENVTEVKDAYITVSEGPALSASMMEPLCNGTADGSIDLTVAGAAPFSFSWSNGETTEDITGLNADNYSVLVTDTNGCEAMTNVGLDEPDVIEINLVANIPDNNNSGIGQLEVEISGGTEPFQSIWTEGGNVVDNGLLIEDLLSGTYILNVVDSNGCSLEESFEVFNFDAPIANFLPSNSNPCEGNTVSFVNLTINNPSSIFWEFEGGSPNTSTESSPDVMYNQAGTYTVTLTVENDAGTDVHSAVITVNDEMAFNSTITNVSCFQGEDGAVDLALLGGESPYSVIWGNGSTSQQLDELDAGNYSFFAIDQNGCDLVGTVTVGQPSEIDLTILEILPDSCNMNNGSAMIEVVGGTPGYTIQWNDADGQTGNSLQNVSTGTYVATVIDNNACEKEIEVDVHQLNCVGFDELSLLNELTVYPNPFDGEKIQLSYKLTKDFNVFLFDMSGRTLDYDLQVIGDELYQLNPVGKLSNGIYYLKIQDGDEFITKKISVSK